MIGARLNSTTTGASVVFTGSVTSIGNSAGVNNTGIFVALAISSAFAFGHTNSSPHWRPG